MKQTTKLPDKPSELIKLAISDLEKAEKHENYTVVMTDWHVGYDNTLSGKCEVCLAGAVMAFEGFLNPVESYLGGERSISKIDHKKLHALDNFRIGNCGHAFSLMGLESESGARFIRDIMRYEYDGLLFKEQMRLLATELSAAGF